MIINYLSIYTNLTTDMLILKNPIQRFVAMSHNYGSSEVAEKSFIKHRNRKCILSATNVES